MKDLELTKSGLNCKADESIMAFACKTGLNVNGRT